MREATSPVLTARLVRSAGFSEAAADAIRRGPVERHPPAIILSSADTAPRIKMILHGWACEMRILRNGRRQIFSFGVPGDPIVARPLNAVLPCTLLTLTRVECLDVEQLLSRVGGAVRNEIQNAVNEGLGLAEERRYDKVTSLCRRSAPQRVAELLLELHDRLGRVDLVEDDGFDLPVTQEQIADALGLSVVHVARSLKLLRLAGVATVRFGRVGPIDRYRLAGFCDAAARRAPVLPRPVLMDRPRR